MCLYKFVLSFQWVCGQHPDSGHMASKTRHIVNDFMIWPQHVYSPNIYLHVCSSLSAEGALMSTTCPIRIDMCHPAGRALTSLHMNAGMGTYFNWDKWNYNKHLITFIRKARNKHTHGTASQRRHMQREWKSSGTQNNKTTRSETSPRPC